ncbi:hypothetical protein H010_20546 [Hydrogenophaga taeniospiralis CCUG 15921]|uniref:Uncharacterized protein n=1 Tax=Hydrogenophaga taeniospiralis CCUG 15921 TaxID=1281780 RepID=A0A9X4SBP3_9BURK|nr:hypothetical protein [Hydrogenophaga taeniospiralis]MDG5977659.1 hypothetical protein [Hydrogenophaga taeniospiralis CCUG 15921]
MFSKLLKREPARLFLGAVSVATGRNLAHHLERLSGGTSPALDRALLAELAEWLPFPTAATVEAPQATDMVFDVVLQGHRFGSATDLSLGTGGLPMYWRPKIRLAARLYHLQSNKTKTIFHVTQKMPWSVYLNRALSWRVLVGLERPARRSDMEALLRQASEQLVTRLRDAA